MKNRSILTALVLAVCILAACSSGKAASGVYDEPAATYSDRYGVSMYAVDDGYMDSDEMYEAENKSEKGLTAQGGSRLEVSVQDKKIIYSGFASVQTTEYDKSFSALNARVTELGGFIERNEVSVSSNGKHSADITLRIPSEHFNEFMNGMNDFGAVQRQSSSRDDVTKQYNDKSIEIEALEVQRERLMDMLRQADNVNDMLSISDRLTGVETRLNILRSRLDNIDTDVAYSTVNIYLYEVVEYTDPGQMRRNRTFFDRLMNTISDSWSGLLDFLEGTLFFIIRFAPIAAVIRLMVWLVRKLFDKIGFKPFAGRKAKKESRKQQASDEPEIK